MRRGRAVLRVARAAVLGRRGGAAVASWVGRGGRAGRCVCVCPGGVGARGEGSAAMRHPSRCPHPLLLHCAPPPAPVARLAPLAAVLPSGRKSRCRACACRSGVVSACAPGAPVHRVCTPPPRRRRVSPHPLADSPLPRPAGSALRAAAHLSLSLLREGCRSESRAGAACPACLRRGGGPRSPPPGVPARQPSPSLFLHWGEQGGGSAGSGTHTHTQYSIRPEASGGYPPNLSISLSGGREINRDLPSSGERTGESPALNRGPAWRGARDVG